MWRLQHHEFWNTHVFHFPVYLYWLYLSLKARSPFFFSAANPGIENGGLIGESKYGILRKIDRQLVPITRYYPGPQPLKHILDDIRLSGLPFPFVVKPDIGQGGWMIDMIHNEQELKVFVDKIRMPFMLQEYVDYPIELGILYFRYPGSATGEISSIARKELLHVTGDGKLSLRELLIHHPRVRNGQAGKIMRLNRFQDMNRVPAPAARVQLSFIGNHSFGTMFRNANYLITRPLTEMFDRICRRLDGFYFGRFDLRCRSLAELPEGKFKILELNGVGSEPLHIFDPSERMWKAYACSFRHWDIIYRIGRANRAALVPYLTWRQAWKTWRRVRHIQRQHRTPMTIGN